MNLFVFGLGYSSLAFVRRLGASAQVTGTVRSTEKAARLASGGLTIRLLPGEEDVIARDLAASDAVLVSVPPGATGDSVLAAFGEVLARALRLRWIGYLSTIGVYGDHGGGWVDEAAPPRPVSARSRERVDAEQAWLALGQASGKAVQVFRLAGIYGPGRSAFDKLADGTAKRLVKPGQVFNRIHVDDIAAVLAASLDRPRAGAIYNVTDDEPAPPQDVVACAAQLAGVPPPPEVPFEGAELTPMARSFYGENKRVRNTLIRDELGVRLAYPTYREGLASLAPAR